MTTYERNALRRTATADRDGKRGGKIYLEADTVEHDERGGEKQDTEAAELWTLRY